jgi:hypothetical protein
MQSEVAQRVDAHSLVGGGGCNEGQAIGIGDRDPRSGSSCRFEFCERENAQLGWRRHGGCAMNLPVTHRLRRKTEFVDEEGHISFLSGLLIRLTDSCARTTKFCL